MKKTDTTRFWVEIWEDGELITHKTATFVYLEQSIKYAKRETRCVPNQRAHIGACGVREHIRIGKYANGKEY